MYYPLRPPKLEIFKSVKHRAKNPLNQKDFNPLKPLVIKLSMSQLRIPPMPRSRKIVFRLDQVGDQLGKLMIYYFHIIFLLKVLERVNFVVKIQTIIIIMYIPWNLYKIICTAVLWEVCKQILACGHHFVCLHYKLQYNIIL